MVLHFGWKNERFWSLKDMDVFLHNFSQSSYTSLESFSSTLLNIEIWSLILKIFQLSENKGPTIFVNNLVKLKFKIMTKNLR